METGNGKEISVTVVAQYKTGRVLVYHDIKSITYNTAGLPVLKKRDTSIDMSQDYTIIAIVS